MNLYEILQNTDRVGEGMTHFERLFAQKVGGGKINEMFGVPPLRYIGDGRPLTDYLISGNAVQDGTPTPENPVPVVGCGTDTEDGFKLPITVNGTEYPIYLGQVETTRRIKKLVLTGEENITSSHTDIGLYNIPVTDYLKIVATTTNVCSHYKASINVNGWSDVTDMSCCFYGNTSSPSKLLYIRDTSYTSIADFKAYLAQQYAAGTPVTVWYVLAEPETGIVNEPLMKIGEYADTVSAAQAGAAIPTVNGENVLDVLTTVPPSEVLIRGRIKEV